jgi:hypothetical protein
MTSADDYIRVGKHHRQRLEPNKDKLRDSMSSRMASRSAGTTSSRIIAPHSPGLHY